MCPFCIGSVVLMAGGSMSAGGLTALVVNNFRSNRETKGTVMRLVDSILLEIDQEAQTTKRVLDRIPEDKLAWKPHPKSFSLGQLALHIASVPGSVAAAACRTVSKPRTSRSRSPRAARRFWTLSRRASRVQRTPSRKWM